MPPCLIPYPLPLHAMGRSIPVFLVRRHLLLLCCSKYDNTPLQTLVFVTLCLPPCSVSLREKLRLEPDSGVSAKYLLASLESDPDRLTKDDQVCRDSRSFLMHRLANVLQVSNC